jgi:methylenetetrahydrofolate dehydrogenase (NADP+)/methenyltetrahydrofolate cyclohydrolase
MALLSGKLIAERILADTKERIASSHVTPGLAVILVGDYIESQKYVALKEERAKEVGILFEKQVFPTTVSHGELISAISAFNDRPDIHGIIVQSSAPRWDADG